MKRPHSHIRTFAYLHIFFYSIRKLFTGLDNATFIACMLMVRKAINNAIAHAPSNNQTVNGAR